MAGAVALYMRLTRRTMTTSKLMSLLVFGGLASMVWGVLLGSVFAVSIPPLLFSPLENPIAMLGLCYGLGVFQIFYALTVAAVHDLKAGRIADAICDKFLWMALLTGLGLMFVPPVALVGQILSLGGGLGILLTAGRRAPKLPGKLIGGLGALYGITGYLSDILSYSRLFALGLATGVVGMVMNLLGGMFFSPINWHSPWAIVIGLLGWLVGIVILAAGHTFNLVISVLGAFIHSMRLQFIEFFSRFYQGGGRLFAPLRATVQHVVLRKK